MPITVSTVTGIAKSYIEIFFRRKWLILSPIIIFSALAIGFSFTIPPKYRTSTLVLIEEEKVSNPLISGLAVSTTVKDRLDTIVKILLSRPILEQLISELNLDKGISGKEAYEDLINSLRNSISVQLIGRDLLKVTAEDANPVVCQKIANSITSIFIKHNLELQMRETNAGIEFLKSQREIYEKKLKEAEEALRKFKQEHQELLSAKVSEELTKIVGQNIPTNVQVLKFTELKGDIIKLKLDLKDLFKKREQLKKQLETESEYIVSERLADPVVKQLETDLNNKQVELAKLEVDATDIHPMVIRLKKEIEELKEKIRERKKQSSSLGEKEVLNPIYQNLKMELAKVETDIESVKTRIKLTTLALKEEAERIKVIPKKEEELANLQRDYNINAAIYEELTKKLETAYITQRLEFQEKGTKFRVVEPATVPLKPFKPNRKFMGFAGAMFGMMVGIALVAFTEMTDYSFTEATQLRNFLNIPVLTSVSQILTKEEAEELKAKKRLFILCLFLFVIFSILGGLIKFILFK